MPAADRDALTYLYIRYADDVYREIWPLVGDTRAAEALTEQLFARLHTTLPPEQGEDRSGDAMFAGWLLHRARNAAQATQPRAS